MIKNDRQYLITQGHVARFKTTLDYLAEARAKGEYDEETIALQEAATNGLIETLKGELKEYDDLKSGRSISKLVKYLGMAKDLPSCLIKARIALNWTQKDLAERIGTSAQQIQRYEDRDYESASLATIRRISEVIRAQLIGAN